jgi:DNA-binding transcriptional regulator YiaG
MYHYTDCGLDNIYLVDGYFEHETEYGRGVSIEDTAGLHKVIARQIVCAPREMTGAEFRFLRIELDLSQRRLAGLLNADEQAVRRWEKNRTKPIRGAAERMLRVLYLMYVDGKDVKQMIERLAELDTKPPLHRVVLRETAHGWRADDGCKEACV